MGAKFTARKYIKLGKHVVVPQSEPDLGNMLLVLRLKLAQHPELRQQLLDTGDEEIVEDCGNRPGGSGKFWGAAFKEGRWVGENTLGKLWMRIREELRQEPRLSGQQ